MADHPSDPRPDDASASAPLPTVQPAPQREVVEALCRSIESEPRLRRFGASGHPPRPAAIEELLDLLRRVVFVGFFEDEPLSAEDLPRHIGELIASIRAHLEAEIRRALRYTEQIDAQQGVGCDDQRDEAECAREARRLAGLFLETLPRTRDMLASDVQAALDGDPAARHLDEIVLCYPGVEAVFTHRVAHALHRLGVPLIPRMLAELAHSRTGVDIHPGATIGPAFFIDHGTGVVIGETTVIGERVKIYQGVTLGAKSFPRDEAGRIVKGLKRHPTIGNNVTIYADAVILGGDTRIGDDCIIAGSVFLTESVPDGHMVLSRKPDLRYRASEPASVRASGQHGPLE